MKAQGIDQFLNESIGMSYYLLPPVNHHQLTELFGYHNYNDRLWLANQKPNTNSTSLAKQNVWNANLPSKDCTFGCKYLSFHAVYGLETLRIYLYSPSLRACKVLDNSEIQQKNWLKGF